MSDDNFMEAGDLQIADDGDPSGGKYFQVAVPRYSGDQAGMHSFLRLGKNAAAVAREQPSKIGAELWAQFSGFKDITRARAPGHVDATCPGPRPPELEFGQSDDPAALYANAGWRDHCDGNRISTTGGDKVEVVRGNYQMIVLGRQPLASGGTKDDRSGGHAQTGGVTGRPQSSVTINWVQDVGGTWRVQELREQGDVHAIYRGDRVSEFFGGRQISTTGGYPLPGGVDPGPTPAYDPAQLPVIVSGTLAERIDRYTGTAALPIPRMHTETHAVTQATTTCAVDQTVNTTVTGVVRKTTTAASIIEETTAERQSTFTGSTRLTYFGDKEVHNAGSTTTVNLQDSAAVTMGSALSAFLGARNTSVLGEDLMFRLGGFFDFKVGLHTHTRIGGLLDVTLGHKTLINWGTQAGIGDLQKENRLQFWRDALFHWYG